MLTEDGRVKVLDFGLARPVSENEEPLLSHESTTPAALTAEGTVLGTVPYMSPEQVRGKKADHRTDVWALGCVVYEMLTGKRTFGRESSADTVAAVVGEEPDWQSLPTGTPRELRDLIRRCLRKDLGQRQRDVGDIRLQLDDLLNRGVTPDADDVVAARPERSLPALLGVTVAGAVAGGGSRFLDDTAG